MRSPLIIFAALFTTSVAAAEPPGLTAPAAPAPSHYVAFGGFAGVGVETLQAAWTAEGGVHLAGSVWAHALAGYGGAGDDQGTGVFRSIRAGVDTQSCTSRGIACVVAGFDLGYQHVTWTASYPPTNADHEIHDNVVAIARLMLDAGGEHVRVHTGVELGPVVAGYDSVPLRVRGDFDLTAALAYRW
jgi:hypothetical protein